MQEYTVNGWVMEFPDRWLTERDQVDGHWLFYPPDSELTVHVTPFRLERDGIPAPAEAAREVFRESLRRSGWDSKPEAWAWPLPAGFGGELFAGTAQEGGKEICRLCLGFYGLGELLSVNIYGDTREECQMAMDCFQTLKRA